jgi:hypothetical protein
VSLVVRLPIPGSTTRRTDRDEEEIWIALEAMRGEENVAEMMETSGS